MVMIQHVNHIMKSNFIRILLNQIIAYKSHISQVFCMLICMQLSSYMIRLDIYILAWLICLFYSIRIDMLSIIKIIDA